MPKISALTLLAAASIASNDLFAIVDVSATQTKKTTMADVRTALFGQIGGGYTATDYIALGTTPGSTGAINVDAASYTNIPFSVKNGANTFNITMSAAGTVSLVTPGKVTLYATSEEKWATVGTDAAGTASWASSQATARIVGGSTNGLAIRNSGNTRDNYSFADAGNQFFLNDGTRTGTLGLAAATGENPAGIYVQGSSANSSLLVAGTTNGSKAYIGYYDQTQYRSAAEVATATGFSTLALMKSGGTVQIGATGLNTTAAIGASTDLGYGLDMQPLLTTRSDQRGLLVRPTFNSTATAAGYGGYFAPTTQATSFTQTNLYGAYIDAVAKGAGSTITNRYGLFIVAPTDGGTTNEAIRISATAATATKFLNVTGSTTAGSYMQIQNTTGNMYLGVDNSTGNVVNSGGTAYAVILASLANTPITFWTNTALAATLGTTGNLTVVGNITASASAQAFASNGRGTIGATADGVWILEDNAGTSFNRLMFGGSTSSFPAIKRNSAALNFRLADDSADADITTGKITASGVCAFGGVASSSTTAAAHPAGTTGVSSLRIPHGVAPTSPVDGDMWSTTTTLNFRLNGVTKSITMT